MAAVIKPERLKQGDMIAVVAPASWPDHNNALKAEEFLNKSGFKVKFGNSLTRKKGYLAGTDQERAEELQEMFSDEEVKGIFSVCGGYGSARIAPLLDYEVIRNNPKVFWGYSDITFLHISIFQKTGLVTFHGPMLSSDIGKEEVHPLTYRNFDKLAEPASFSYTEAISPLKVLSPGRREGKLIGGNLSLIVSGLGTPYEIDTKGKLLFIEETDEEPYQIDRMLNQLKQAGKIKDSEGILLCDFNDCGPKKRKESLTLEEVFNDHIVSSGKPVISGFKTGHCSPNIAFPVGAEAILDTTRLTVEVEEPFSIS